MAKPIVLQFVATDGLSSDLIKWFGHGWCCHVDTVMEDGQLLGARQEGGVQIRPPDYETFRRRLLVTLPTSDQIAASYYDFVRWQIGKPYDMEAIAAFAAGRNWRDHRSWFCSELVAAALEYSGYLPFNLATPENKITPPDLLLVCSTRVQINPPTDA